jgi:small GTP-binding protein
VSLKKKAQSKSPRKVVLLGDSATGKTSLLLRFVLDEFCEGERPTMEASLIRHTSLFVKEAMADVELEIRDFNGQERYRSMTPLHYLGVDAAIIVYDITNIDSFVCAKKWIDEVEEQVNPRPLIFLIGNKRDLELQRMVSRFHSEAYACEKGVLFKETSAKTAHNVREIFYEVARLLVSKMI